ncbi:TonB-dependent vitamin B12 receptor [Marinobacterium rhizophilum]|uniref:TonB-dependent vitamin B12 receptor n=1 Tax=Marinobacterium rhizophilum TaxID=420402 RepID=UPI000371BD1E|nr:TonB-dependent vitamin B12 receptor [Marinobacterium rhizophilum]
MKSYSLPAALLLGSSVVLADTANTLSPVIVTATRTAQTADETLASVTVITREQIEREQASNLPELLGRVPGVQMINNGGRGKNSSIFMRGTNSDQVLVLIDGIKAGSATLGAVSFEHLALDQIERIEIVRGPRSSLYGSEAIGGVIQIFTRKGGEGVKPRVSAEVGSHGSRELAVGLSGGTRKSWYNLSLSDFSTDGFDSRIGLEPDNDGYDNQSVALSAGHRLNEVAELSVNWSRNEGENEFDGNPNASDNDLEVLGAKLRLSPTAEWNLDLSVGRSTDESTNFTDGVFFSRFDTERDVASLVSEHFFGDVSQLTWGLDYQEDQVSSNSDFAVRSRDNVGVFGLYQLFFGRQDLAFSLRHDDNEQFGSQNTGSVAWGLELAPHMRLVASYGTAFKAPTFNDLYWPGAGNPALQPEESESWELGLSGDHAGVRWSANLYQTDVDNLIAWQPSPTPLDPFRWIPMNVNEARIRGLELVASTRIAHWDLSSSLDLLDPKDRSDDSVLNRRARKVLNVSADRDFGRYSVGGALQAVGKRPDGSEWLGGYTKVDLRAGYQLAQDWSLKGRIENLFDKDYQTAAAFNQDGRTYWLSLHYAP